jgi:hypothetical protein
LRIEGRRDAPGPAGCLKSASTKVAAGWWPMRPRLSSSIDGEKSMRGYHHRNASARRTSSFIRTDKMQE